ASTHSASNRPSRRILTPGMTIPARKTASGGARCPQRAARSALGKNALGTTRSTSAAGRRRGGRRRGRIHGLHRRGRRAAETLPGGGGLSGGRGRAALLRFLLGFLVSFALRHADFEQVAHEHARFRFRFLLLL